MPPDRATLAVAVRDAHQHSVVEHLDRQLLVVQGHGRQGTGAHVGAPTCRYLECPDRRKEPRVAIVHSSAASSSLSVPLPRCRRLQRRATAGARPTARRRHAAPGRTGDVGDRRRPPRSRRPTTFMPDCAGMPTPAAIGAAVGVPVGDGQVTGSGTCQYLGLNDQSKSSRCPCSPTPATRPRSTTCRARSARRRRTRTRRSRAPRWARTHAVRHRERRDLHRASRWSPMAAGEGSGAVVGGPAAEAWLTL